MLVAKLDNAMGNLGPSTGLKIKIAIGSLLFSKALEVYIDFL